MPSENDRLNRVKKITFKKLLSQKLARKKKLKLALQKIIKQLKNIGAIKIIVFGSYVSGNIRRFSDLDILAVMPSCKSGKEWFKEIYDSIDTPVPADILPFTKEELKIKIKTSSFIRYALKTGRCVYERQKSGSKKLV